MSIKKTIAKVLLVTFMCSTLFSLAGMSAAAEDTAPELDPTLAAQMCEDYLTYLNEKQPDNEWTIDDVRITEYFGNYKGLEVVYMEPFIKGLHIMQKGTEPKSTYRLSIEFAEGRPLHIYGDSDFFSLDEAPMPTPIMGVTWYADIARMASLEVDEMFISRPTFLESIIEFFRVLFDSITIWFRELFN